MKKVLTTTAALLVMATSASAIDLSTIDKDGNGTINSDEFLATFAPERGIETFRFMDKNGDGEVDTKEFWVAMMGQGPLEN